MTKILPTLTILGLLLCSQAASLTSAPSASQLADESTRRLRRTGFDYLHTARAPRPAAARIC